MYLDLQLFLFVSIVVNNTEVSESIPFWSVAQGQNKLQEKKSEIEIFQDGIENRSDSVAKWESSVSISGTWTPDKIHDNRSSKPERSCFIH